MTEPARAIDAVAPDYTASEIISVMSARLLVDGQCVFVDLVILRHYPVRSFLRMTASEILRRY